MPTPEIPSKSPIRLELEPGRYAWCSCGKSSKQPFCDGAHAGSEFRPHVFEVTEKRMVAMCNCKHTGGVPFCDGAHKSLP